MRARTSIYGQKMLMNASALALAAGMGAVEAKAQHQGLPSAPSAIPEPEQSAGPNVEPKAEIPPAHGAPELQSLDSSESQQTDSMTVVTGYRGQQSAAIKAQRNSNTIADFIFADEIAQQPDYNIADALRRVPGVQTVFDEDEGRYVAIRGLSPDYTISTFNGLVLASSERGNRRINMEMVPANAVRMAEVVKARLPGTDGNAVGGMLNLNSRSPYDAPNRFFLSVDAYGGWSSSTKVPGRGYHRKSDDGASYRASGTLSYRFGRSEEFGIMLNASYNRRRRDQERYLPNSYVPAVAKSDLQMPREFLWSSYPNTVDRYGGQALIEYRPSNRLSVSANVAYYTQHDHELRYSSAIGTSGTVTQIDQENARASAATAFNRFNNYPIKKPLWVYQGNLRWDPDDLNHFDIAGGYSRAKFLEKSNELRFNYASNAASSFDYNLDGKVPKIEFENDQSILNTDNYKFNYYRPYKDDSTEKVTNIIANYGRNADRNDEGFGVIGGIAWRRTVRDFDRYQLDYSGSNVGQGVTMTSFVLNKKLYPSFLSY